MFPSYSKYGMVETHLASKQKNPLQKAGNDCRLALWFNEMIRYLSIKGSYPLNKKLCNAKTLHLL